MLNNSTKNKKTIESNNQTKTVNMRNFQLFNHNLTDKSENIKDTKKKTRKISEYEFESKYSHYIDFERRMISKRYEEVVNYKPVKMDYLRNLSILLKNKDKYYFR